MAAGLFPLTGSMAYLGPANIATMKLAQKDINAAGGVLGKDIEITSADTSDADHADQNTSSAQSVIAKNPSSWSVRRPAPWSRTPTSRSRPPKCR